MRFNETVRELLIGIFSLTLGDIEPPSQAFRQKIQLLLIVFKEFRFRKRRNNRLSEALFLLKMHHRQPFDGLRWESSKHCLLSSWIWSRDRRGGLQNVGPISFIRTNLVRK